MEKARLMPAVGAGFTLIAQRPLSALVWGLLYMVLALAPLAALLAVGGDDLVSAYRDILTNPQSMESGPPPIFAKLQGIQALQILSGLAAVAIVYTAILRAVLRPRERAFCSIRFGMDELRVAGVTVVLYIFMILGMIALAIVFSIPAITVVALSGGQPSPAVVTALILLGVAAVIALLPVCARIAMALPMTVAQGRFRLVEAWALTKGYGWKLVGVFLLIVLILLALEIVVVAVGSAVFGAMTGGFNAARISSLFSNADGWAQATPLLIAIGLLYIALITLVLPITVAPWARAYELIDEKAGASASALFE